MALEKPNRCSSFVRRFVRQAYLPPQPFFEEKQSGQFFSPLNTVKYTRKHGHNSNFKVFFAPIAPGMGVRPKKEIRSIRAADAMGRTFLQNCRVGVSERWRRRSWNPFGSHTRAGSGPVADVFCFSPVVASGNYHGGPW